MDIKTTNCIICKKEKEPAVRKTCSHECYIKLRSVTARRLRKEGKIRGIYYSAKPPVWMV